MYNGDNILIVDILKILKKHSDEEHRLTQKEIIELLENHYHTFVDRKTVKDNMERLIRYSKQNGEDNIEYETKNRKSTNKKTGEEKITKVYTDFGFLHDFTQPELRLIIDSILFSKHIPNYQRKELIMKLESLTSKHFDSRVKHIRSMSDRYPKNKQLFSIIAVLDEAISKNVQVSFNYNSYDVNEKSKLTFEPRKNRDGSPREYIINPYQMVAADGRYYLICNNDRFDDLSHYRVDRMTNIEILKTKRTSIKKVKGYKQGLDLQKYMEEHVYMFTGDSVSVSLRFKKYVLNEFIEFFNPENISFSKETEDEVTARVRVNRMAIRNWALRYALHVRVLSPEDLVEEIRSDIEQAWENYQS